MRSQVRVLDRPVPLIVSYPRIALVVLLLLGLTAGGCASHQHNASPAMDFDIRKIERQREVNAADEMLNDEPITVTASHSPRSAGGKHDFFSEGDYWWPDPANPDGPYIQRDGMTNPDNFVEHRHAMIRFSIHVAALTSAWRISE